MATQLGQQEDELPRVGDLLEARKEMTVRHLQRRKEGQVRQDQALNVIDLRARTMKQKGIPT
jgi:hypothetical protein